MSIMLKKWMVLNLMIAVSAVFLFGCAEHGTVDQGRDRGFR